MPRLKADEGDGFATRPVHDASARFPPQLADGPRAPRAASAAICPSPDRITATASHPLPDASRSLHWATCRQLPQSAETPPREGDNPASVVPGTLQRDRTENTLGRPAC